jgi:hypothetical protein
MNGIVDLNEAREARCMGELLSQLDEALRAAQIDVNDPHDPLGRAFAVLRVCFERQDVGQRAFQTFLVTFAADLDDRLLRLIEDGQAVAERYQAAAKDELAKVDRMARKAEADLQRKQLAVQDSTMAILERVIPQLVAGVKEASVIRARAFNRALYARHLAVGMAVVVVLLGSVFELGRLTKVRPLPVEASQSQ